MASSSHTPIPTYSYIVFAWDLTSVRCRPVVDLGFAVFSHLFGSLHLTAVRRCCRSQLPSCRPP